MEECARLCGLGSWRGCRCPQKRQRPAEMAAAEGKQCLLECHGPAEKAAPEGKPAWAEKRLEADAAARRGGMASPMPPPHCSLQDLPVEMLVEIFASLPSTDLASLAQACTKFRHIVQQIEGLWDRRCREEYGFPENLPSRERRGMSYRKAYAKMFPYRHMLGLWQLDLPCKYLLNVAVDGLCITGWRCWPSLEGVDGPMQLQASFGIRPTEGKSATVDCMDGRYVYSLQMQIQKDRFRIRWIKRDL